MLAGFPPFFQEDENKLRIAITRSDAKYPSHFTEDSTSFIKRLIEKDAHKRLGMIKSPYGNIRESKFFAKIDWIQLQNRQIEPPFRPKLKARGDFSNFDESMIAIVSPKLSQMDKQLLKTIDENIFEGFNFVSEELLK